MKHNKKRNTAFLYECLIKELTKAIVREDKKRQTITKNILREFFYKGSILKKELEIYNSLLESKEMETSYSHRLLQETKKDFYNIDRKKAFNEQTRIIKKINKALGHNVFSNFVPNYKDIASFGLFFQNERLPAKKRIMLESNLVKFLGRKDKILTEMKHLDNLEYKTFVKKFNNAYERTLQKEQKDLLTNYIVSFSDNGVGLKSFLNQEIGRLKGAVQEHIIEAPTSSNSENFKKVKTKLDNYAQIPINQQMVEEIFYIQDLIAEVSKNGHSN
tara:strand:+ start:4329 stop:5150 length:822 start_codon:yes stop_codon:yes gene_type:complete